METTPRWTLDELVHQVAVALASGYGGQASGRVRDLPDRRAVRYYTTLGLVDRPSGWRGRVALYGQRHLLQLTAIKRLQAQGLALAEIQHELTGRGDAALERLAGVPDLPPAAPVARNLPATRPRFWAASAQATAAQATAARAAAAPAASPEAASAEATWPRAVAKQTAAPHPAAPAPMPDQDGGQNDHDGQGSAVLQAIRLGSGLILLVEGGSALDEEDLGAVRAAAESLVATVRRLRRGPSDAPSPAPLPDRRDDA
jgi:DNA-binding transcriptional MerR regulator